MRKEKHRIPRDPALSTRPSDNSDSSHATKPDLHRQCYAWRRRPQFECGCFDPCRCDYRHNPSDKRTEGYRAAIEHLAAEGLLAGALTPELRSLWRRGGSDRRIAETIVRRWAA
jgi:hypothetical protein